MQYYYAQTLYNLEEKEYTIGDFNFKCIYTPGHSKGSLTFYVDNKLFTGDALFYRSIGRTDFYDGDFELCSKLSIYNDKGFIKDVYLDLPVGTHVGGIAYDYINNNIFYYFLLFY